MDKQNNSHKGRKWIIIVVIVIIAMGTGFGTYYYLQNKQMESIVNRDVIYEGITIEGVDVGGLTKEEALYKVGNVINENIFNKEINMHYKDKHYVKPYDYFEFKSNFEEVVNKAYQHFKSGKLRTRYNAIMKLKENQIDFAIENGYNQGKINEFIESIKNDFHVEAKDAIIHRKNGEFMIEDEIIGLSFDVASSVASVKEAVDNFKEEAELVITEIQPKYTAAYYGAISDVLGEYSTSHNSNRLRTQNLKIAASRINGTLLHPGEDLETHVLISPINKANGYKEAPIIIQGEIKDGLGGGVCQISSTLYNAALFAELDIIERQNHSMPVSYTAKGRDATMSGNQIDFVFENSTKYPIYVESFVTGGKVYMRIYGKDERKSTRSLQFKPVIIQKIAPPQPTHVNDDTLEAGTQVVKRKAVNGYKVKLYKYIYDDGKYVEKQVVNSSYYRPVGSIIRVGTKQPADVIINPEDGAIPVDAIKDSETVETMAPIEDNNEGTTSAPVEDNSEGTADSPVEGDQEGTSDSPAEGNQEGTPSTPEDDTSSTTPANPDTDADPQPVNPTDATTDTNEGVDVHEAGESTGNNP